MKKKPRPRARRSPAKSILSYETRRTFDLYDENTGLQLVNSAGSMPKCSANGAIYCGPLVSASRAHPSPNNRIAFSFMISGRTSSLMGMPAKSAIQRSGVSMG